MNNIIMYPLPIPRGAIRFEFMKRKEIGKKHKTKLDNVENDEKWKCATK